MTYELEAITDGDMSACALVPIEALFAPAIPDCTAGLLEEYQRLSQQISTVAATFDAAAREAIAYFLEGHRIAHRREGHGNIIRVNELLQEQPALAALDATYWQKAMNASTIYEWLPNARRQQWAEAIRDHSTPRFTPDNVHATFEDLFLRRGQFLAERVDGIFSALSRTHLTNSPMGFGKRMILHLAGYGGLTSEQVGAVHDLRCIVAKFMGREEQAYSTTYQDMSRLRALPTGCWYLLDGGAIRIRMYMKGTVHLEVHPDMAWRLNAILHTLHPQAIPSELRSAPTKAKAKVAPPMARPLPFQVLDVLRQAGRGKRSTEIIWGYSSRDNKHAFGEAQAILAAIGGTPTQDGMTFDYPPDAIIDQIILSGCIPDKVSHQYYPTPAALADRLVEWANIQPGHACLEPSAGIGNLAQRMAEHAPTCVEISALHCQVLREKGFEVEQGDFLDWAQATSARFDRIVMNPPFTQGQASAHVEAAARLLRPGGRLVAIVPASMRSKVVAPGCSHECSPTIEGAFPGVSIAVMLLAVDKPA